MKPIITAGTEQGGELQPGGGRGAPEREGSTHGGGSAGDPTGEHAGGAGRQPGAGEGASYVEEVALGASS